MADQQLVVYDLSKTPFSVTGDLNVKVTPLFDADYLNKRSK